MLQAFNEISGMRSGVWYDSAESYEHAYNRDRHVAAHPTGFFLLMQFCVKLCHATR
jgi:hypothetical protein